MARAINRVTLLGNLGQDPDMRVTAQGKSVCTLRVATSESYKDGSGEWREITDWHNVVLWDWLADSAGKNCKKGSKVYIEGKLKTRSYERDGVTRYITEVVGQVFIPLDLRPREDGAEYGTSQPAAAANNFSSSTDSVSQELDDDVPF